MRNTIKEDLETSLDEKEIMNHMRRTFIKIMKGFFGIRVKFQLKFKSVFIYRRGDSKRYYRTDGSPPNGPNSRHHSSHSGGGGGGGGNGVVNPFNPRHHPYHSMQQEMFDSRKRHTDMMGGINPNKKLRKNW